MNANALRRPVRWQCLVFALVFAVAWGCRAPTGGLPRGLIWKPDTLQALIGAGLSRTFDGVPEAAAFTSLRATPLPEGRRELRIWRGGGLGWPQDLYRFVDDGRRVSGELVLYWHVRAPDTTAGERPGETFHDLILYSQSGRCEGFRVAAGFGICRGAFTRAPDWNAVLRRMEREGVWTLPDATTLPNDSIMVLDGWGIIVELRDGPRYRWYHYSNPDAHKAWPEAAKAVRIAQALHAIDSLLRTADVVRTYRGVTTGRYRSEFVDCVTGARWEFSSELRSLAERSNVSFVPAADSNARYVIEVVGELSPEWLARRWGSKYRQVLQVPRLVSARPSPNGGCT